MTYPTTNSDPKELTMTCPCGTPDDANGHHVCPDLPSEEVHVTSEGLATVTIHQHGRVLGIGHGFTLSDARAQAQSRARGGEVVEAEVVDEDTCWACDGATDEQRHTCDRYPELTAADLETLDAPLAPANLTQLVADYLEANADDGDGPPSVWDFVLWTLHR